MSSHFILNSDESLGWRKYIVDILKVCKIAPDYTTYGLLFMQLFEYLSAIYSQDKTAFKPSFIIDKCGDKYEDVVDSLTKHRHLFVHRPADTLKLKMRLRNCLFHEDLEDFITEVIEPDESCLYSELMLFIGDARKRFEVIL